MQVAEGCNPAVHLEYLQLLANNREIGGLYPLWDVLFYLVGNAR